MIYYTIEGDDFQNLTFFCQIYQFSLKFDAFFVKYDSFCQNLIISAKIWYFSAK